MITGSLVAIVTPMQDDGSLDFPRLRSLIDWHIAEGSDGIVVVGTTGESPTVTVEEHCEIIRVSVEQAAGRAPVMAGCGANSTAEAIELAKFARSVGADCQLQVVPYYNKPTQEGQYQHFKAIAEATGDHQWIHVDVERAKAGPFGGPIAHGFLTLEDDTDFLYKCTAPYAPHSEHTLAWNDPAVGIDWPIDFEPQLAAKDVAGKLLREAEVFESVGAA